ncbi:hypothetical protein BS639_17325 [Rouxiella silvae]|uniref:Helix-turn-helix domain-containing protein n=1 Tax=Rouxiella silvae TaxID=1646373 RepID=A0ABX3TXG3_9GAMM|nr:STY4528 family pathogenicity island replication protein [Rouxiella silvae]ORJ19940.1 hypothetical protein BS639_17325 [Rouxiella silvae]
MNFPAESLIQRTVAIMNAKLAERRLDNDVTQLRSGLLYLGNVHDAIPRRLLLDARLSPLDKMAWMMIRLYAQQNEGAVFPSYDDLQLQLASPNSGKASRETVSRVLLMLRITGWLSLCKRVRDDHGRVRGNIYAQHDEPLTLKDAELFDPNWLNTVAEACRNKNKTISLMAAAVLQEIRLDPLMRHHHSHITLIEARLNSPQTPQHMAKKIAVKQLSSDAEPSLKLLSSESEPCSLDSTKAPNSETELSAKSASYNRVRDPNGYVRSLSLGINKNTYVVGKITLPESLKLTSDDREMLEKQLSALPEKEREQVLSNLNNVLAAGRLANPVGWLLAMMKKARDGLLFISPILNAGKQKMTTKENIYENKSHNKTSSPEMISKVLEDIRRKLAVN